MTSSKVANILISSNRSIGVRLLDGKVIRVKEISWSSINPFTLIFNLIGEEFVDRTIDRDIKKNEWIDAIFGLYLALHSQPEYKPEIEINKFKQVCIPHPH